jgi:hypothetical protein
MGALLLAPKIPVMEMYSKIIRKVIKNPYKYLGRQPEFVIESKMSIA